MKILGEKNCIRQNGQNTKLTKQKLNPVSRHCRVPWRPAKESEFQQRMLLPPVPKTEVPERLQPKQSGPGGMGWRGSRSEAISGSPLPPHAPHAPHEPHQCKKQVQVTDEKFAAASSSPCAGKKTI